VCGGWTRRKTKGILRVVSIILPSILDSSHLFTDLNTASGTEHALDVTVDGELTGSDGANHEETGTDTTVRATDTELLGDLDQTGDGTLTRSTLGLVDLGEHGVGGLGDDGGGETSDETGAEVDTGLGTVGESLLVDAGEDGLGDLLEDDELGHGVGDPVDGRVSGNCIGKEAELGEAKTYCLNRMGPNPE
jgi:hypothetical protein